MDESRQKSVKFASDSIENTFLELKSGKFHEKELAKWIEKAIIKLVENQLIGVVVPQKLWPVEYVRNYGINNLRKCNLPGGWRLRYTVKANNVEIIPIILEWLPHHEYERRFGYKQS